MRFELLANEIIIDLFEYLKSVHLLRTFHNLNIRFNNLLFYYFQIHAFDFQSVSDIDFDNVCRQHLSSIVDQITSFRLSDNDNIPYQIDRFLTHGFTFQQFSQLQKLTLDCNSCKQVQDKLLFELHHIPTNLTHLTVILNNYDYYFSKDIEVRSRSLVNIIWSLPKLIHCKIGMSQFPLPTTVSTSLQYLSIVDRCSYYFHDITHLFEYTPHLRQLNLPTKEQIRNDHELSSPLTSVIALNIGFYDITVDRIINFFKKMPNLYKLTFRMRYPYINAQKLEEIIRNDLIQLKILRFEMLIKSDVYIRMETIHELLKSYSSPFWLEEHRWFVRCDWQQDNNFVYLYTLPYAFHDYCLDWPIKSLSTCSFDHDFYCIYNRVQKLTVQPTSNQESVPPYIHFPKVNRLFLSFPINNQLESISSNFVHLTSLYLIAFKHNLRYQSQVQALLDRLFHLHRLHFDAYAYSTWARPPFEFKHTSVRELGLITIKYNSEQCVQLARSPLGRQCEVLYIYVKNRTCILDLVKTMANLRFLYVLCFENQRNRQSSQTTDQLIEWLQHRISSKWTIARENTHSSPLVFWIR